jgi:hypothetical protein
MNPEDGSLRRCFTEVECIFESYLRFPRQVSCDLGPRRQVLVTQCLRDQTMLIVGLAYSRTVLLYRFESPGVEQTFCCVRVAQALHIV